jgi:hypothetical protein
MKKELSSFSATLWELRGLKKLGQPVPDSNLVSELKNSSPHPAQT